MSETVKLIVEIDERLYERIKYYEPNGNTMAATALHSIANGTPLDSNSEKAEVQAYFDGEAYGWEQGQKDFAEKLKAEIETNLSWDMFDEYGNETRLHKELMEILDSIGKGDKE